MKTEREKGEGPPLSSCTWAKEGPLQASWPEGPFGEQSREGDAWLADPAAAGSPRQNCPKCPPHFGAKTRSIEGESCFFEKQREMSGKQP